jgi:integrase
VESASFTEQHVGEFLTQFTSARFSFGYVRSMYCALRVFFRHNFPDVTFDPKFWEEFLNGAKNMCKRRIRKEFVWNPQEYVDFITTRPLPRSMAQASRETVTILALSTGLRSSDLRNMGRKVVLKKDSIFIPFLARGKTRPQGIDREGVTIARYTGPERLCVMTIVKRYIYLTELTYKKKGWTLPDQLFVSSTTPSAAQIPTIRGWLKRDLAAAGIRDPDGLLVPAHSIRSASTSAAYWQGLSFDQIKNLAGWSSDSCFQEFYKRKLVSSPANLMQLPSDVSIGTSP